MGGPLRIFALSLIVCAFAAFTLLSPAAAAPTYDPYPLFEQPPWHAGFFWNYTEPSSAYTTYFGNGFYAREDNTNVSIVGETTTPRGDAWVVYETTSVSAWRYFLVGANWLPAQVNTTGDAWYLYRKADLALLNWTLDVITDTTFEGAATVRTFTHNETVADPPLLEIPWGQPVLGAPWRTQTTLNSTGWEQVESAARADTSTLVVLDYNSSAVYEPASNFFPAPPFSSYHIVSYGTKIANRYIGTYHQEFWWAPDAQQKLRDSEGWMIGAYYIDWPPGPRDIVMVSVEAGGYNDTMNPLSWVDQPRGPATYTACTVDAPALCTVAPTGELNVSAPAGINATLFGNLSGSDGLPYGNFTQRLVISVRGPGNTNQPPTFTHDYYFYADEDTDYVGSAADFFADADGDPMWVYAIGCQEYFIVAWDLNTFTARAEANRNPQTCLILIAFDTAGNVAWGTPMSVIVRGVNDPPWPIASSDMYVRIHAGESAPVYTGYIDPDSYYTFDYNWSLDGVPLPHEYYGSSRTYFSPANDAGIHILSVVLTDGTDFSIPLNFTIFVYAAPKIVATFPPTAAFGADVGSSRTLMVRAVDDDSPDLYYRWTAGSRVLAAGMGVENCTVDFPEEGLTVVRVEVSDDGSWVGFEWRVTVAGAPPGLAWIHWAGGPPVEVNDTVELEAGVDGRLAGATFVWSLDGEPLGTAQNITSAPLAEGSHTFRLEVTGWYHGTAPYREAFELVVEASAPVPPPPPPPPPAPPAPPVVPPVVPVEVAPREMASLATSVSGGLVAANATVEFHAIVNRKLSNVTYAWSLDGVALGTAWNGTTPRLSPGSHTLRLHIAGTYNGTSPYDETFETVFEARLPTPPPAASATGSPEKGAVDPVVAAGVAIGAAAAVLGWVWMKRRRN